MSSEWGSVQHRVCCTWWRHQMETFSALLAICAGNSPVTGEFPSQRPVTRSFDVFFDLRLEWTLSKQSWGWWFETPSRPLWRHCNEFITSIVSSFYSEIRAISFVHDIYFSCPIVLKFCTEHDIIIVLCAKRLGYWGIRDFHLRWHLGAYLIFQQLTGFSSIICEWLACWVYVWWIK